MTKECQTTNDQSILWTIQPATVWAQMEQHGSMYVDRRQASYRNEGIWQYDWLSSQLARQIHGYAGGYPWWAYCKKPDLRTHRHLLIGEHVCIGFCPAPGTWIRFPIWMWDTIYSGRYLAQSYEEFVSWTQKMLTAVPDEDTWPLPDPWGRYVERSWGRLFDQRLHNSCWLRGCDPNDPRLDGYWPLGIETGSCEAVGETLRASEVVEVRHFRGTGNSRLTTE